MTSRDFYTHHLEQFLRSVRELVEIESPTSGIRGIERAATFLADALRPYASLEVTTLDGWGPLIRAKREGTPTRVLLLAHLDTVWPVGSWPCLWRADDDRIYGPGVYDMKAGVMFAVWLLRYLDVCDCPTPTVEMIFNPDEETGSTASRPALEAAAQAADFVLVLEPTTAEGVIKVARKGSGEYRLTVHGRAAHQGVEPEHGINAVVEASRLVTELVQLESEEAGTTLGPNVFQGGSVSNVVPDCAEVLVDVRAWTADEMERIADGIAAIQTHNPAARLVISGGWNRPPMEPTPLSLALFHRASAIARRVGTPVRAARWGGSSDANLAASAGAPTIDGLGPVGAGSHQLDEHIVVSALPDRQALLTELVISLAEEPLNWLPREASAMQLGRRSRHLRQSS